MSNEADGKNSLVGEFLLALARSPESVQEAVIMYGIKQMVPYSKSLIEPYPMLSHLLTIIGRAQGGDPGGMDH